MLQFLVGFDHLITLQICLETGRIVQLVLFLKWMDGIGVVPPNYLQMAAIVSQAFVVCSTNESEGILRPRS